jgi:hypothetical protein
MPPVHASIAHHGTECKPGCARLGMNAPLSRMIASAS